MKHPDRSAEVQSAYPMGRDRLSSSLKEWQRRGFPWRRQQGEQDGSDKSGGGACGRATSASGFVIDQGFSLDSRSNRAREISGSQVPQRQLAAGTLNRSTRVPRRSI